VMLDYSCAMLDLAQREVPAAVAVLADIRRLPFRKDSLYQPSQ